MRKLIIGYIFFLLISCKSKVTPGEYRSSCNSTDAPSFFLVLKKDNTFSLEHLSSVSKLTGTWKKKQDTLVLNSHYEGHLIKKDSIPFESISYYIIKKNKLIPEHNQKCYLKYSK